jgi:hypothetical protein
MERAMGTFYSVWDTVTGNIIDTFDTEQDVVSFIRAVIEDGQRELVEGWVIGQEDEDGGGGQIAGGQQLIAWVLAHAPT